MTLIVMERVIGANEVESLEDHQWSVVTTTEFSGIFGFDLPLQYLSKDCGIFCVLYAFYLMFHKQFDFCQNDMTTIRFKLLKIIKECAVSPIVLEYIKDITCDSWALLAKERLRGSNIGMLPKEMLVKFFEEACENKYDISCLKNVCQHWNSLLDKNFEVQIHKKKIKNAINWTSKQSDCKNFFQSVKKQWFGWRKI